jgi:hypothetical protein
MPNKIIAIRDMHKNPGGRMCAKAWLEGNGLDFSKRVSGAERDKVSFKVGVFFMEWHRPIDSSNVSGSFTGLASGDAKPSLVELALLADKRDIDMVACDKDPEAVKKDLGSHFDHVLVSPQGKALRDQHAVTKIVEYFRNKSGCTGLLMFGSDHFTPEDGRPVPPLHELIKAKGIPCELVY